MHGGYQIQGYHSFWCSTAPITSAMNLEDIDGMAYSVHPGQTAPSVLEQSDLGLPCLLRPICLNTFIFFTLIHMGE